MKVVKSVSSSQEEIIRDILDLHCKGEDIQCDPTYSKGVFYRDINRPLYTFDLDPQDEATVRADCRHLPLEDESIKTMMFDPPFLASKGPSHDEPMEGRNIIARRFSHFSTMEELWRFYDDSLKEFYRVLEDRGVLIFKCQDVISSGKHFLSSHHIVAKAAELGFYCKDMFILVAKSRMSSGKWKVQRHSRKFHSYFLVFEKRKRT